MATRPEAIHGLSLCAGIGGIDLGISLALGERYRTAAYVEQCSYCAATLVARMADSSLDPAVVADDLAGFDGKPWRGKISIISAGLPCQPYSVAGRQRGHADPRAFGEDFSGPVPHALRIIGECLPALVFLENVPGWIRFFRPVGEELARLGYRIEAGLFSSEVAGAPHRRERFFVYAERVSDSRRTNLWEEPGGRGGSRDGTGAAQPGDMGGEVADALDDEIAEAVASVDYRDHTFKTKRLYCAFDNPKDERTVMRGLERLARAGVKPDHIMVYMLIGYWPDETHEDRDARRKAIREFGARPYPMPFIRTPELVGFQRWCIFAWDKTMPWSYFESMHYGNRGRMYDDPRKVDKDIQLNLPRLERNEWPAA